MKAIPVLYAEGDNLPDAWESVLIELKYGGCKIRTQYDKIREGVTELLMKL